MAKTVIIIGSGIIGSSIAWHMAKAGATVTVVDALATGGVATAGSWAWINASWGNPEPYFRLRERAMLEWRRIDREVPGLEVDWCGGLLWDLPREQLEAFADEHEKWGYGIRRVSGAEISILEPTLKSPPDFALHVAEEGKIEPLETAQALLAGAAGLGADVLANSAVRWLVEKNGRVTGVALVDGVLHADEVIIAAGTGSGALAETIGVKLGLMAVPGLLTYSKPLGEVLRGLVMSPALHVKQDRLGRLVAGSDFTGTVPDGDTGEAARKLHEAVQQMIAGAEHAGLDSYSLTERPTPSDGFPLVGYLPGKSGAYVAVTHSGVTLAPAIGRMVAEEVLHETRDGLLAPYAVDRLAQAI